MGTETYIVPRGGIVIILKFVKLNNPLMGTETSTTMHRYFCNLPTIVKLNNPLMGTETPPRKICE